MSKHTPKYSPKHTVAVEGQAQPVQQVQQAEDAQPVQPTQQVQQVQQEQPSVARSTAVMSVATLASRVTGLARTWVMAFTLGNTLVTSAYQVANSLPTIMFELVAGGLLSAAFVPLYLLQTERFGKEGGDRYASNLLNIVVIVMAALALLCTIFAPQAIGTQTFTISEAENTAVYIYAVDFFRIFAVQVVFYGLGGVFTSILNANRVYFAPAIAPLFNNIVVIATFIVYLFLSTVDPFAALWVLGIGTTLGVVVQFAVQIPAFLKLKVRWRPRIDLRDKAFLETLRTGIPMIIYVTGTLVSFSIRNAYSFESGEDGPSTLLYAWIWFQLPHGILAASLARALFTEMSDDVTKNDIPGLKKHIRDGLAGSLLLIIPLAGLIGALAQPLMLLFRAGLFQPEDVIVVSMVLSVWVCALPFYTVQQFMFMVFSSVRRFTTYAVICTALCVLQCALYALLSSPEVAGLTGIPLADIAYYGLAAVLLPLVLRRHIGSFGILHVLGSSLKVLGATAIGCVLVSLGLYFMPPSYDILGGMLALLGFGSCGLVIIYGLCALFRVPEMSVVTNLLRGVQRRLRG